MENKVEIIKVKDGLNGAGAKIGELYLVSCLTCKKEHWVRASIINRGSGKYCSKGCRKLPVDIVTRL